MMLSIKRRNAAIEQERAIQENELNTEIRIAEKPWRKKREGNGNQTHAAREAGGAGCRQNHKRHCTGGRAEKLGGSADRE